MSLTFPESKRGWETDDLPEKLFYPSSRNIRDSRCGKCAQKGNSLHRERLAGES